MSPAIARRARELADAGEAFVTATVVRAQRPTSAAAGDVARGRAGGASEGCGGGRAGAWDGVGGVWRWALLAARVAAGLAVVVAGYFGIRPPGFVAQVVAMAYAHEPLVSC